MDAKWNRSPSKMFILSVHFERRYVPSNRKKFMVIDEGGGEALQPDGDVFDVMLTNSLTASPFQVFSLQRRVS